MVMYSQMWKRVKPYLILLLCTAVLIEGLVIISYNLHTNGSKTSQTSSVKPTKANPPTRAELLKLVNAERKKVGVAPLKEDKRLDWSAQKKADDEVKYDYFGHMRDGKFIGQQFIDETGITCPLDSENLTKNIYGNTAKAAVDAWVASKPHYKAMVNPKYTLTGFGIAGDEIVEHFCEQ